MPKRILVIDDNADCLDVMKEALTYEGFEVKAVQEADNIFSLLEAFHPDLLLIDYILAGVNGGEVCSQIKNNAKTSNLPIIIVSAYSRVIDSLGYYGCNAFISKPFDLSELTGKTNELIGGTN